MSDPIGNSRLAIVGDFVTDVLFPAESKTALIGAKETLFSASSPNEPMSRGIGGTRYVQDLFSILFHTHFPQYKESTIDPNPTDSVKIAVKSLVEQIALQHPPQPYDLQSQEVNYWMVEKKRKYLSSTNEEVYRVIENLGRYSADAHIRSLLPHGYSTPLPQLPEPGRFKSRLPDLLVLIDHNRQIRRSNIWNQPDYRNWLTHHGTDPSIPRRIILLANRLPKPLNKSGKSGEVLWETLFNPNNDLALKSTIIVTSIDRLRQEGASISKRLSWDETLADFLRELKNFEPLVQLGKAGHLIVRIGVVGAIHCYWQNGQQEIMFLYDPNATYGIYRDRALQGNAFAMRSVMPACIAFHVFLEMATFNNKTSLMKMFSPFNRKYPGAVRRGIKDSINLVQELYTNGFGNTLEDVREFMTNSQHRIEKLLESAVKSHKDYTEKQDVETRTEKVKLERSGKASKFIHIIRPPIYSEKKFNVQHTERWSILRDNLRAMIKEEELFSEVEADDSKWPSSTVCKKNAERLYLLEELRRVRMARAIVFLGVEEAINNLGAKATALRKLDETRRSYLLRMLNLERRTDSRFCKRLTGEINQQNIRHLVTPEWFSDAFPLNAPIATFGGLRVLGRTDTENFSSIRNLLSKHLSKTESKPLSIAVFGSPGSGKSFGIKAIAKAIGGDSVEDYTCNLSQLTSRDDLNGEFFNAFKILLGGKTPLIFFDEFDCSMGIGGKKHDWLKYFLEPMQDGIFRHPDGVGKLRNSIMVFAGGIANKFGEFYCPVTGKDHTDAIVAKLPDFVSRLQGIIDVPGLNKEEDNAHIGIPYVRRALILRGAIEEDKRLLDNHRVARIDRNIVDAFLRVSEYRHGARSINAILNMCSRWNNSIEKSSIPTETQLEIHTDGNEFWKIVMNPVVFSTSIEKSAMDETVSKMLSNHSSGTMRVSLDSTEFLDYSLIKDNFDGLPLS